MAHMQQIEIAIGQRDPLAIATPSFNAPTQFFAAHNFGLCIQ
jgi:hypothetical protein